MPANEAVNLLCHSQNINGGHWYRFCPGKKAGNLLHGWFLRGRGETVRWERTWWGPETLRMSYTKKGLKLVEALACDSGGSHSSRTPWVAGTSPRG